MSAGRPSPRSRVVLLVVATCLLLPATASADAPAATEPERSIDELLTRAVEVTGELHYEGQVAVVSIAEDGPRLAALSVTRAEGGLQVGQADGDQLGRTGGEGFLQSSSRLLRVGGIERVPDQLDRLRTKYRPELTGVVDLDTGPATAVALIDRDLGVVRERLYADIATGLIVRRETFGADGDPVRLVAFTELQPGTPEIGMPSSDGRDVEERHVEPREVARLREEGFEVPETLGRGFELLATLDVPDASVPTAHLVYGDGLYTVSVFQQLGRLDRRTVGSATELTTPDGGSVWRWPGSEPRRLVWTGDGTTFTALGDAPTDELVAALAVLPTDPAPGLGDRLLRGLQRLARGLMPG